MGLWSHLEGWEGKDIIGTAQKGCPCAQRPGKQVKGKGEQSHLLG